MRNTNLAIKLFLKLADSIRMFFTSIIGPNTKNPMIAPIGNLPTKLLAIKASDVEQAENKKAMAIMTKKRKPALPS